MAEHWSRPPPVAELRGREAVWLAFSVEAPGEERPRFVRCDTYKRAQLESHDEESKKKNWAKLEHYIIKNVYGVTWCGTTRMTPPNELKARPGVNATSAQDFTTVTSTSSLVEMADIASDCLCVEVLVSALPPPRPETLRFWVHRSSTCGLDSKRCLEAAAKLLEDPPADPRRLPNGTLEGQGGGVGRLLQELGLWQQPREQSKLHWYEKDIELTDTVLRAHCERVRDPRRTLGAPAVVTLIVGSGDELIDDIVTSHSCVPARDHETRRIRAGHAGISKPWRYSAGDIIDNSLAAACEATNALRGRGLIVFRIITGHPDRPGTFLQFINNFQGMDKTGLEKFTRHGGFRSRLSEGQAASAALFQDYVLNCFGCGVQNTIYSMGNGYMALTRRDSGLVYTSTVTSEIDGIEDDEHDRKQSWIAKDKTRSRMRTEDHEKELLAIYPPCVVEFQKRLEYEFPHFTSLMINGGNEGMCTVASFLEIVKVLRDKYGFYLGWQELLLQGGPKPTLPECLNAPPEIVLELIDYNQLKDSNLLPKFDFERRRTSNAVMSVCLNDLPWAGWPYAPPPPSGNIIEGNIEQLLRLSRANTISQLPPQGASTSSCAGSPQHFKVQTELYNTLPLENAFVIGAEHLGNEQEGTGSYGRVMYVTMYGPEIAGCGVFKGILASMANGGLPIHMFAYVRGRWAVTEVGNIHPPHVELALKQLEKEVGLKYGNKVLTLAFFEQKEKTNMTGDRFQTSLNEGLTPAAAKHNFFWINPETFVPDFSAENRVEQRSSKKGKKYARSRSGLAIVVDNVVEWIKGLSEKADAKYFREGGILEPNHKVLNSAHTLWSCITDQKGAELESGSFYYFPLKSFPIAELSNASPAAALKSCKKYFYIQRPEAPSGSRQTLAAQFMGLAVQNSEQQAGTEDNKAQPVTHGYLVVKVCLLPGVDSKLYLRLHGALRDIKRLDVASELKIVQSLMPFEASLPVEVQCGHPGEWVPVNSAECQDVNFLAAQLMLPQVRLRINNLHAKNWSMASATDPCASGKLAVEMSVWPLEMTSDDDSGIYPVKFFGCMDDPAYVSDADADNHRYFLLNTCDLKSDFPRGSAPRPGVYSAKIVVYAGQYTAQRNERSAVTVVDERPLGWPTGALSDIPWVCDIPEFFRICPQPDRTKHVVEATWPSEREVSLETEFQVVVHIWDSTRRPETRLLCSSPELEAAARGALTATLPDDPTVELETNVKTEWVHEERGQHLLMRISLSMDAGPTQLQTSGGSLPVTLTLKAGDIVIQAKGEGEDLVYRLDLVPGQPERATTMSDPPQTFSNGCSPGQLTFYFQDQHGLPAAWGASGWSARLKLESDHGIVDPESGPEVSLDTADSRVEFAVPEVRMAEVPPGGAVVTFTLEMLPPQRQRGRRPDSARLTIDPISMRIFRSGRMERLQLSRSGGDRVIDSHIKDISDAKGYIRGRKGEEVELRARIFNDSGDPMQDVQVAANLGEEELVVRAEGDEFVLSGLVLCEPYNRMLEIVVSPTGDTIRTNLLLSCARWVLRKTKPGAVSVGDPLPVELGAEAVGGGRERRVTMTLDEAQLILGDPPPLKLFLAEPSGSASGHEVFVLDNQSSVPTRLADISVERQLLQGNTVSLQDRFLVAATGLPPLKAGTQVSVGCQEQDQHCFNTAIQLRHGAMHSLRLLTPPSGLSYDNKMFLYGMRLAVLDVYGNTCLITGGALKADKLFGIKMFKKRPESEAADLLFSQDDISIGKCFEVEDSTSLILSEYIQPGVRLQRGAEGALCTATQQTMHDLSQCSVELHLLGLGLEKVQFPLAQQQGSMLMLRGVGWSQSSNVVVTAGQSPQKDCLGFQYVMADGQVLDQDRALLAKLIRATEARLISATPPGDPSAPDDATPLDVIHAGESMIRVEIPELIKAGSYIITLSITEPRDEVVQVLQQAGAPLRTERKSNFNIVVVPGDPSELVLNSGETVHLSATNEAGDLAIRATDGSGNALESISVLLGDEHGNAVALPDATVSVRLVLQSGSICREDVKAELDSQAGYVSSPLRNGVACFDALSIKPETGTNRSRTTLEYVLEFTSSAGVPSLRAPLAFVDAIGQGQYEAQLQREVQEKQRHCQHCKAVAGRMESAAKKADTKYSTLLGRFMDHIQQVTDPAVQDGLRQLAQLGDTAAAMQRTEAHVRDRAARLASMQRWQAAPTAWKTDAELARSLGQVVERNPIVFGCVSGLLCLDPDYSRVELAASAIYALRRHDMNRVVVASEQAGAAVEHDLAGHEISLLQLDLRWRRPAPRDVWPVLPPTGRYVVDLVKPLREEEEELAALPLRLFGKTILFEDVRSAQDFRRRHDAATVIALPDAGALADRFTVIGTSGTVDRYKFDSRLHLGVRDSSSAAIAVARQQLELANQLTHCCELLSRAAAAQSKAQAEAAAAAVDAQRAAGDMEQAEKAAEDAVRGVGGAQPAAAVARDKRARTQCGGGGSAPRGHAEASTSAGPTTQGQPPAGPSYGAEPSQRKSVRHGSAQQSNDNKRQRRA